MSRFTNTIGTCQGCGCKNEIMYGMSDTSRPESIRWMDAGCASSWADAWSPEKRYALWVPIDEDTQTQLEQTPEWAKESRT